MSMPYLIQFGLLSLNPPTPNTIELGGWSDRGNLIEGGPMDFESGLTNYTKPAC
jgi:hypothetical protein